MRVLQDMNASSLRLAYAFEFLLALLAIFTMWSEIGGQGALDLMNWGWKLGFSVALAGSTVAFTASIVSSDVFWTPRSLRWLGAMLLVMVAMGVVTYFYALQEDIGISDETGTVSFCTQPQLLTAAS
jgi:glucan phosphoethanolaminetransferase (alkaline phosphatase superfamily)